MPANSLANSSYMKSQLSTVALHLNYLCIHHNLLSTGKLIEDLPSLLYSLWEPTNYQTELPKTITSILVFQTMSKLLYFSLILSPPHLPLSRFTFPPMFLFT